MAGLLLVGHGDDGDGGTTGRLARELSPHFAELEVASLNGGPSPGEVLAGMTAPLVHVLPVLTSAGRMYRTLENHLRGQSRFRLHRPLGMHPGLAGLAAMLLEQTMTAEALSASTTAAFILAHGNAHDPDAARTAERLATALAGRVSHTGCLFLAQAPRATAWRQVCEARDVVLLPLLFADGGHRRTDLAELRATTTDHHRLHVTSPLGNAPGLAECALQTITGSFPRIFTPIDQRQGR